MSEEKMKKVLGILRDHHQQKKKSELHVTKHVMKIAALKKEIMQKDKDIQALEDKMDEYALITADLEAQLGEPQPYPDDMDESSEQVMEKPKE